MEYDIELASPKLLDVRTGTSIVPYNNGKAISASTDVFNNGAVTCPVAQGDFWIGMTDGKRHATLPAWTTGQFVDGYYVNDSYTASELPIKDGYKVNGIWNDGVFALVNRDENAGALWGNGSGANPQLPDWPTEYTGNLLYIAAPTLAALWRAITVRKP